MRYSALAGKSGLGLPVHGSRDWFGGDPDHAVAVLASSDWPGDDGGRYGRCCTGTHQLVDCVVAPSGRSRRLLH